MGFLRAPRHLTIAEFDPGETGDLPGTPAAEMPPTDPFAGAKPFAQQDSPSVQLDPIFGTPLTELGTWMTAKPGAADDEEAGPRVEVEVLGNGYQVNGAMVTGQFDRLSDWLNMQQGWVNVHDGLLFRPGREVAADRQRTSQWVRLNQVVLVAERQKAQRERGRGTTPYVKKERRRVTITTQEFQLRGDIHIVEAGSIRTFLESPDPHFLPMTDVVVRWLADDTVVNHYPFALVNRGQLISVSEDIARDTADYSAATVPDDGQPGWLRSA